MGINISPHAHHPAVEGRAGQMESALPFQNRTLAIERQMKRVLVDDRINHHSVTSKAFLDDAILERCATDPAFFASLAGSFFALGHLHEVFGRFDIEYFTGFVTDDLSLLTADPETHCSGVHGMICSTRSRCAGNSCRPGCLRSFLAAAGIGSR